MASIKKDTNGKWYCRVSYKDENGKYRTKTKKGFTTKKEATVYAATLETKKSITSNLNEEEKDDTIIFAEYFEKWCYTYRIGRFSKSTDLKYEREIRYVEKHFQNTDITQITREMYQDYLNFRGKGNSKDTVDKAHNKLSSCLRLALADGIITKDPTFNAVKRYDNKPTKILKYMSYSDAQKFIQYLLEMNHFIDLMLLIAVMTGLRIGEVFGLSYNDITENTLSVKRGFDYNHTKQFTECKTESSKRTIIIPTQLYTEIQKYRLQNMKINPTYLFLDFKNKPRITHNGVQKHLAKILHELDIPKITIHGLRHTHTSILIFQKMDILYISKRLGHSNVTETLKTYAHILDELNQSQDTEITAILETLASAK